MKSSWTIRTYNVSWSLQCGSISLSEVQISQALHKITWSHDQCVFSRSLSLSFRAVFDTSPRYIIVINSYISNPGLLSVFDQFQWVSNQFYRCFEVRAVIEGKRFCLQATEQINSTALVSSVHLKSVVNMFSSGMWALTSSPVYLCVCLSDSLWFSFTWSCTDVAEKIIATG